jgi:hypothetical protein
MIAASPEIVRKSLEAIPTDASTSKASVQDPSRPLKIIISVTADTRAAISIVFAQAAD